MSVRTREEVAILQRGKKDVRPKLKRIILKFGEKWMLLCEKGEWIRNRFGKAVTDCLEGFNPSERMIIMVVGDLSRKGRGLKMSLFKDQVDYGEFQV